MTHTISPALAPPGSEPALAPFAGGRWADAAAAAYAHAPYLRRLMQRRVDLLADIDDGWPERLLKASMHEARAIAQSPPPLEDGMQALRRAKDGVHLAAAIADLAGAWPLARVTGALSEFADASVDAALALGVGESIARGDLKQFGAEPEIGPAPGLALIAMGKMGAGELNYSSDIDFSVFFDAEILAEVCVREPRVAAVRLVAPLVRALEEITVDGYVFRTDLRLRPDPGSTPVAVSMASAEHYYQNLGQNWERAAFIKARAAAGDKRSGGEFLDMLSPFIWRKHLDFAAIEDVHSIKRQILSAHKSAVLGEPVFDVKLGRGGIRDIELFAQTQQLILGGRNKALRVRGTIEALAALADAGAISSRARDEMSAAYDFYRGVEHRIQMLEDAQTHRVPADPEIRARVAALSGYASLEAFDKALVEARRIVSEIDHELFGRGESLADPAGSLIFTGVEDHPETLRTIETLGFTQAAKISETIRGWHHGRVRAMRSERARELLTRLTPRLLRALAAAGDPDQAFTRFAAFFSGLNAGVQVLSLLDARPALLDLIARVLTIAPRLADTLAHRPALLDALIEPRFLEPITEAGAARLYEELTAQLRDAVSFEAALNAARRFQREEAFRIGVQVLEGLIAPRVAGEAHAELAQACVRAMADAALREVERQMGPQPGAFVVLALGKFGGRELAEGSDLDLMLVYEPRESAPGGSEFYTRLTQRLIRALSAPTEEGALYEIDTKLRPSGSQGPVAVRLSSFERYYAEEAWTWELQALTRARPVAGDAAMGDRIMQLARTALSLPRDAEQTRAAVASMRARMQRDRRAETCWDLKLAPGGFIDIEFIAQALQLTEAARHPEVLAPNTGAALERLAEAGALNAYAAATLRQAWALMSDLQQVFRICVKGEFSMETAPAPLRERLAALASATDAADLEARLQSLQNEVRAAFVSLVGPVGDGSGPLLR